VNASAIRKGYVDTSDGQIHYLTAGAGDPSLIMLHQNPSSGRMWEAVIPGLAQGGRRVIAFDTPGYGMSEPPPVKPDIPYYARRIVEAADGLGLGQFDVLGHHTGALIASVIAADYPGRVRKLIAVGFPLLDPAMTERLSQAKTQEYTLEGTELPGLWEGVRRLGGKWLTPAVGVRCLIEKLQAGPNWNWAYHAVAATDVLALLPRISVPTLSVCGGGDPICQRSAEAVKLMANGRSVVIEDGGVNVADDAPAEFINAVDDFLRGQA
jgi:pimeloyl-ACP methyl ester carboxylesterase